MVCTEITLAAFKAGNGDSLGTYSSVVSPNLGAAAAVDLFSAGFYGGGSFNGDQTGTFNLASGGDNNYQSCSRCMLLFEDATNATGKTFFQQSGTLVVAPTSDQLGGTINATLSNLTLIEVTIDADTYVSTPVPNGQCLHVTSASVAAVLPTAAPAGWTCNPAFYADGDCDCGCGVVDNDCAAGVVGLCAYCDNMGSCNSDDCPGTINPTNNGTCTP